MGRALAELCEEIDIVVHGEAETTLPPLIVARRNGQNLRDVPGITFRQNGSLMNTGRPLLLGGVVRDEPMDFDGYFERLRRLGLCEQISAWIPFETSRGCWYGEKQQCTFCGLNEIIKYRKRQNQDLVAELSAYEERYAVKQFFGVDLIMPIEYPSSILPQIEALEKDWLIFYEVKSNLKRKELEQLARAGVRWIQPGIETLDDAILKLMNKGVSAAQNAVFLKWCSELAIDANWNLITGFPGESFEIVPIAGKLDPENSPSPASHGRRRVRGSSVQPVLRLARHFRARGHRARPAVPFRFPGSRRASVPACLSVRPSHGLRRA